MGRDEHDVKTFEHLTGARLRQRVLCRFSCTSKGTITVSGDRESINSKQCCHLHQKDHSAAGGALRTKTELPPGGSRSCTASDVDRSLFREENVVRVVLKGSISKRHVRGRDR